MKVLIIGNGGREHALCWKLKQSQQVTELFSSPGNAGTAQIAQNVSIGIQDVLGLKTWALEHAIDFTVVGPEIPLSLGIVDQFKKAGLSIFGVTQKASQLEASKVFSKKLLQKYRIPTALAQIFNAYDQACDTIASSSVSYPLVIKADGLAQGKGVVICSSAKEAKETLDMLMKQKQFGGAGNSVVIENFLEGEELSYLGLMDGNHFLPLATSQDHKKILEGDQGPNTGGMGAYSPVSWFNDTWEAKIQKEIVNPLLSAFKKEGIEYQGILYIGLLISKGVPYVLEFNVRFGDPEAQVLLCRLQSDLLSVLTATMQGKLNTLQLKWDPRPAVGVVMTSGGYPGAYQTGYEISGL